MRTAIAAVVALLAAPAWAGEEARSAEPLLRISRLTGKIEVETPGRAEAVAGQKLPYIAPGSIVRVISGRAAFQSDLHATIRAGRGDAFQFQARGGEMRLSAVERDPADFEVVIGSREFRPRRGAVLSVASTGEGELTITTEESGPGGRRPPSEKVVVRVPEDRGFGAAAISPAAISVGRRGETGYTAQADWPTSVAKADRDEAARRAISGWPRGSRRLAESLLAKYGPPDASSPSKLVWSNTGYWKRTVVHRAPGEREDVLEQTIDYKAPRESEPALARLDLALRSEALASELTAVSESEETNFLAINLADEVARGRRTPEEARAFYIRAVRLSNAGKQTPYMQGLLFLP